MARADYFDRSVHAAFQVLEDFDQQAFLKKIDNHRVAVAFDSSVQTDEGDTAIDLTIRLLARFYPKIALIPLNKTAQKKVTKFKKLALAINPRIAISENMNGVKDIIVVGKTLPPTKKGVTPIYIGSDGWVAKLSRQNPVGSKKSNNPFGAGCAACLAAANIFRHVFTNAPLDDAITISVLDMDPQASKPLNPIFDKVDLGQVFLVGAGAIGNGFLWALSRYPVLSGQLNVVDHDNVDLFNIQRYVLTERKDEGTSKVKMASDLFVKDSKIKVIPISKKWEDFVSNLPEDKWIFERVVSALDTANDRINLQSSLPKWIVNAWTGTGDAGVSHHDFSNHACMACLYMPAKEALNEDQLIAQALGLSQELPTLMEIRTRLDTNVLVDREFLERISAAKAVPIKKLLPYEGHTLRSLYSHGVCSGAVMELANGPVTARAEVPMPFQSAFAGILEAATLIAHASEITLLPTVTRINLMNVFPSKPGFSRNQSKHHRCFCNDKDYQDVYDEKYGS
ncbi:E2 ligase fold family C protein [Pseudomonadota bacterium]